MLSPIWYSLSFLFLLSLLKKDSCLSPNFCSPIYHIKWCSLSSPFVLHLSNEKLIIFFQIVLSPIWYLVFSLPPLPFKWKTNCLFQKFCSPTNMGYLVLYLHCSAQCFRCQLGCSGSQNFPCISGSCYRSILSEIRVWKSQKPIYLMVA